MNTENLEVRNNPDASRFEIELSDGNRVVCEYNIAGKNIIFTHTEVPEEHEGEGLGSKIARYSLDWAKDNDYKIQALCPFIAAYVKRHPEYQPYTWGY